MSLINQVVYLDYHPNCINLSADSMEFSMSDSNEFPSVDEGSTLEMHNSSDNFTDHYPDWGNNLTLPPIRSRRLPPPMDPLITNLNQFQYYGYPVIFTVGTMGNVLSYLVFRRSRLRKMSSVHYLAGMAITDTGFLWTFFLTPMHSFYRIPIIVQDGLCQVMTFLNYVFTFLSIWYLVALVVERCIGEFMPLQRSTICTPFRAKLVMSFMAVVGVACYSYVVYFFGPGKMFGMLTCMPWPELHLHFENISKIDTFVIAVIPYCVIIIAVLLILMRKIVIKFMSSGTEIYVRPDQQRRVAVCDVSAIVYPMVVLTITSNLPVMIMRVAINLYGIKNRSIAKWNQVFYMGYILNFAVKYFVYIIFSRHFRRRTWKLLKVLWKRVCEHCQQCRQKDGRLSDCDPQRITMEQVANGKRHYPSKTDI